METKDEFVSALIPTCSLSDVDSSLLSRIYKAKYSWIPFNGISNPAISFA